MTNTESITADVVRIAADHNMSKHLGNWTTARSFEVRARRGAVVIDLRSPAIAEGDIELAVDIDHSMVKLLLPSDATVDQWGIEWTGRGRIKDLEGGGAGGGRRVVITGRIRGGEIRVNRGGIAILSALFSREFVADALRAHREGAMTTIDDPTRAF
ncbi:hypothetical protein [Fodinicola feengrottensis]|uniref:SRPBCC family protein n=1 Tax=Fodinicola feengrottensis TaxID=435914 RepID=A0ABN2I2B3_9ACTN|nr:hypothetical protein [Fodinicola feengrottensis]